MKTARRLFISSGFVLLGAYSLYTTIRLQQLETRLHREPATQFTISGITYGFDDSFRKYFGQDGIAAVERALRREVADPQDISRELRHEKGLRLEIR